MCERLRLSVENLIESIGERPAGKTLDRISSEGHYSCGICSDCRENGLKPNVQWSTPKEQSRNRKDNRLITFRGETQPLATWADISGLPYQVLRNRLNSGWPIDIAMTAPLHSRLANLIDDEEVTPDLLDDLYAGAGHDD